MQHTPAHEVPVADRLAAPSPPRFHEALRSRGRAVAELVLATVLATLFLTIVAYVVAEYGGSDLLVLVALAPASWLAARALRARPATLFSIAGRFRWAQLRLGAAVAFGFVVVGVGVSVAVTLVQGDSLWTGMTWPGAQVFLPAAATILLVIPLQAMRPLPFSTRQDTSSHVSSSVSSSGGAWRSRGAGAGRSRSPFLSLESVNSLGEVSDECPKLLHLRPDLLAAPCAR